MRAQHLGQHFLVNRSAIKKIISELKLAPSDTLIEIGPGHGELTSELARTIDNEQLTINKKQRSGIAQKPRIVAIEKDERLATELKQKYASSQNIEIVEGDALKILPNLHSTFHILPTRPYKLVGNIPYYITGHLLRIISEMEHKPERAVFMIQLEVAERITANPPRMNRLAASVQYWAAPSIVLRLTKEDFSPPPDVDSAVIMLESRSMNHESRGGKEVAKKEHGMEKRSKNKGNLPTDNAYYCAVHILFQQPRKTIINNAAIGFPHVTKTELADILKKIGVNPADRPQNLSIEDIERIAKLTTG